MQALDWKAIASACGTTPAAASKRYSRMKLSFEKGEGAAPPSTPKKGAAAAGEPSSGSKRKRAPASTKKATQDQKFKLDPETESADEEDETQSSPKKRTRTPAKPEAKGKRKMAGEQAIEPDPDGPSNDLSDPVPAFQGFGNGNTSSATFQGFDVTDGEETFFDAAEELNSAGNHEDGVQDSESLPHTDCLLQDKDEGLTGSGVGQWLEEI